MGKNLHEQNKQLVSICMCCFNKVREGPFYGHLPGTSQICCPHNTGKHCTGASSGAGKVTKDTAHISPIGLCCVPKNLYKASCSSAFQGRRGFTDMWELCHCCQQAWQPYCIRGNCFRKESGAHFQHFRTQQSWISRTTKYWCCRLRPRQSKI